MKLCFLAPGNSIHTVRWVNALIERGHEVHLITVHPPELDQFDSRLQLHLFKGRAPLAYYTNRFKVKKLLNRIQPDLVSAHYASGYGTLSRLVKYEPTLLSVWGSDVFVFPYESTVKRRLLIKNLRAATQIASTSGAMKVQTEKWVTPKRPIEVTPFGVDFQKFRPHLDVKKDPTTLRIGMIKALEDIYGPQTLIDAFAHLLARLKEEGREAMAQTLELVLVGKGSRESALKTSARALGMEAQTTFVGAVPHDEVPYYLNTLDLFCAPSLSESFGVAVIEASACEVPVIASHVGGLPEVVKHGETGYLIEPNHHEELAQRLYEFVLDPEKRRRFGKQGRAFVQAMYDWEDNVTKMEQVMQDLINETKPSPF